MKIGVFKRVLLSILCVLILLAVNISCTKEAKTSHKPLIGIMLNSGGEEGYSIYPWYALRKNYGEIVAQMGGVPVFIGHDSEVVEDYIDVLDGIILTGGDFNTSEEAFTTGVKNLPNKKEFPREYIELTLIRQAYEKDIPIIGTCAGMQEMNVALGGTLFKNLKESLKTPIQHRNEDRAHVQHDIAIDPNSFLYKIVKTQNLGVNSNHHAGINIVASQLKVSATAPDGVIEAFEAPNKRFFVGVMWHPEFVLSEQEKQLWQAFIEASAK